MTSVRHSTSAEMISEHDRSWVDSLGAMVCSGSTSSGGVVGGGMVVREVVLSAYSSVAGTCREITPTWRSDALKLSERFMGHEPEGTKEGVGRNAGRS